MTNLFNENTVSINQNIETMDEAIETVGQMLINVGAVTDAYIPAMKERENTVSTFMGNFLAIPHGTDEAKTEILQTSLALLQIPEGLDWNGEIVKVVIGIAGKDGEHLELLSKIAITFSEEENANKIINAKSVEEINHIFEEAEL